MTEWSDNRQQNELTNMSILPLSKPFHGSSGSYSYPAYKNMGHWSPLLRLSLVLIRSVMMSSWANGGKTYAASDQWRSAGQSNAPVTSWLNPWSHFMFRERGGMTTCPLGTSHSRTADLRVLVSSPRAPEAPLPSYNTVSVKHFQFEFLPCLQCEWYLPPHLLWDDLKDQDMNLLDSRTLYVHVEHCKYSWILAIYNYHN